jgi:hypothetical protein
MDGERTAGERAAGYWFEDGLPELLLGAAMTIFWGSGYLYRAYFHERWFIAISLLGFAAIAALWWNNRAIIEWLKSRITYPRTGCVRPPADPKPVEQGPTFLFVSKERSVDRNVSAFPHYAVVAVLFAGGVVRLWDVGPWGVFAGVAIAAILLYVLNRSAAPCYSAASLLPLIACGAVYPYLKLPSGGDAAATETLCGLWLLRSAWRSLADAGQARNEEETNK